VKARTLVRPGSGRWSALMFVASILLLVVLGYVYTHHVQRQSEQKWCALIVTMTDAYNSQPPQTELGQRIAADMAKLRRELGCSDTPPI
jgi:hypothetical protein